MLNNIFILIIVCFSYVKGVSLRECGDIKNLAMCCAMPSLQTKREKEAVKLCQRKVVRSTQDDCYWDNCIATAIGYFDKNGRFNKETAEDEVENLFFAYPSILENAKQNCINGNLSYFGTACVPSLLKRCLFTSVLTGCPNWSKSKKCTITKDKMKACITDLMHQSPEVVDIIF